MSVYTRASAMAFLGRTDSKEDKGKPIKGQMQEVFKEFMENAY